MAKKVIRTGTTADPTGDSLKNAFTKVNDNFTELYNALGLDAETLNLGAFEFTGSIMTTTDSSGIIIDQAVTVTSDLTVSGDIFPSGGLLGQVWGDGIDTELTLKSPPGVGDSGYVALSSANERNYVEVSNIGVVLAVEFGQAGFKKIEFDNTGNLTAPGIISAPNINATNHFMLPVYATEAARDSIITSPQPGMMVFVTGGEGAGLQVRGATQWNPVGGLTGV